MRQLLFLLLLFFFSVSLSAQDIMFGTFRDTRVINAHSVETLPKGKLDIRIGHRFGDLFGDAGGWATFYGLENAADILIGAEYGLSDRLMIGVARTKGAGDLGMLITPFLKYRILQQRASGSGLSVTAVGMTSMSTMQKVENSDLIIAFEKFAHRFVWHGELIFGKKFSEGFSLQLSPAYTHRNIVSNNDNNGIVSINTAARMQLSKVVGLILDFNLPLNGIQSPFTDEPAGAVYQPALGVGFEFDTGGHVFQVNLTNATGIQPTDYIPYTRTNWLDGEFRLGFTISRRFNL